MDRIKVERAIAGLTEWQKHVQTDSDIDRDISTAIEALKAQLSQEGTTKDAISRQAALKALRKCQTYLYDAKDPELKIELSSAEAAINNLPTIQPVATDTNVGDKISRQQAIELIKNYCENGCDIAEDNWCPSCQREQFMKLLNALPTVQPEPHEGHWINGKCDLCGEHAPFWCMASTYHESNYCPNCGAKMTISTK